MHGELDKSLSVTSEASEAEPYTASPMIQVLMGHSSHDNAIPAGGDTKGPVLVAHQSPSCSTSKVVDPKGAEHALRYKPIDSPYNRIHRVADEAGTQL